MAKNFILGLLAVIVIVGGIIYFTMNGSNTSGTGTSTSQTAQNNDANMMTTATPQAGLATVVTNPSVSLSDTTAIVTGSVTPNGTFTNYWYEYGTTANLGSKTSNQMLGSGFTSIQTPAYITGLTKNTSYYFRLVAENQYGRIAGNPYTFTTTQGTPAPVGSVPTTVTDAASSIGSVTAKVNGEITPNKVATTYWFEYGKTADLGTISTFSSAGNGSAKVAVSASLLALDPSSTYYFRLDAQNQFGTVNGSILSFKTAVAMAQAMPAVVSQDATAVANTSATLHGTIDPKELATAYWFEYSTDPAFGGASINATGKGTINADQNASSVTVDVSSLVRHTTYYFRLVGQNSLGTVHGADLIFSNVNKQYFVREVQ